jgi:hypothetical protein
MGPALMELTAMIAVAISILTTPIPACASGMQFVRLAAVASMPASILILFAVGRWIGMRARNLPLLLAFLTGVLCRLFDSGLSLFIMSASDFKVMYGFAKTDFVAMGWSQSFRVLLFGGSCLVGALAGKRLRQARYLAHLLKSIPPGSRNALIDLAYEEAQHALSGPGGSPRATPA